MNQKQARTTTRPTASIRLDPTLGWVTGDRTGNHCASLTPCHGLGQRAFSPSMWPLHEVKDSVVARMILGVRNSVLHDMKQQASIHQTKQVCQMCQHCQHSVNTCQRLLGLPFPGERHLAATLGNSRRSSHLGEAFGPWGHRVCMVHELELP